MQKKQSRSLKKLKKTSFFGTIINDSQRVLNDIYNQQTGYFSDSLEADDRSLVLAEANKDSVKYSRGGIKWEIQPKLDAQDLMRLYRDGRRGSDAREGGHSNSHPHFERNGVAPAQGGLPMVDHPGEPVLHQYHGTLPE